MIDANLGENQETIFLKQERPKAQKPAFSHYGHFNFGKMNNLFTDIPSDLRDELFETLLQTSSFHIEKIVSRGHCSPEGFWYDQNDNEWVILLKGRAVLCFEDHHEKITMNPGNYINIEKQRRHRVQWTDPEQETVWLAIHYQ